MFTKKARFLSLTVWTLFLSAVYWGFGNTEYTLPITYTYFAACMILTVSYFLVSGGLRPILEEEERREELSRKRYLADGKPHPFHKVKRAKKFKKKKEEAPIPYKKEPLPPAPNPLRIPEAKRPLISQILMVAGLPFYLIFMVDLILLKFIT